MVLACACLSHGSGGRDGTLETRRKRDSSLQTCAGTGFASGSWREKPKPAQQWLPDTRLQLPSCALFRTSRAAGTREVSGSGADSGPRGWGSQRPLGRAARHCSLAGVPHESLSAKRTPAPAGVSERGASAQPFTTAGVWGARCALRGLGSRIGMFGPAT